MTNDYTISTDKKKLNLDVIHQFLSQDSYWALNIPRELVQRAIDNSICFGIYYREQQVGFARVISDLATFAYLSDVFVVPSHRGKGLSKFLVETISNYPDLQGLRRWVLVTKDAHSLYTQFGFTPLDNPDLFMQRKLIEKY
ncbi:GNAT family N-acetyltransferase [Spirosoma sp. KUDC1026]|uniref:GNAT family N-acetyltransferase n=1 Tax=Spirosoma sp. KUDC1026 TaxID=2745947 RepID=UPI00159BC2E4|nr:GNAT family N-acetyltransferase [Spirosoma sp. KUDC1026]QKZ11628.1 GNAT family N-acetyltransferase [Spirosoma sp. KUDC1026]